MVRKQKTTRVANPVYKRSLFVVAGVVLLVALLTGGRWLLFQAQPAAVNSGGDLVGFTKTDA